MRITAILLADSASVREGLLHVLGAGITRVARDPLPARLEAVLALMLHADDLDDLQTSHNLDVSIAELAPGDASTLIAKAIMELTGTRGVLSPGPNLQVPVVVPIQAVPIPRTGVYEITVVLDGEEMTAYKFEVVKGGEQTSQRFRPPDTD